MDGAGSLLDLLAEEQIVLKSYRAGHSEKIRCPKCGGGRTREASLSVTIDEDADGARWKCHRGSCGWPGGGRVWRSGEPARKSPAPPSPRPSPAAPTPDHEQARPPALYAFFEKRGIGPDTVDAFGCYIAKHWFPESGEHTAGEYPAIVFPYFHRTELVNRKYRPPHKNPMMQDKNALATLFNVDALGEEPEVVWWVEGEPDVMALHEVGYTRTVTLKDGAPATLRDESDPQRHEDKRFAALETHADLLGKVKKFVLAGDMDVPGQVLREELARRLGRHRCWIVVWPDGCKDAGDALRLRGPEAVQESLERALPYPIEGLQKPTPERMLARRHAPPLPVLTTGVRESDLILKLPAEGRLIVITGIPNHGKTAWVSYLMVHLMVHHRRRFTVFSPEMQPWDDYVEMLCEVFAGKAFHTMDDSEIVHATRWLGERLTLLVSDAEETPPTVEWMLEKTRVTLLRDGTTDLVIDPWNEVEHARGDMGEVEYLGRKLQQLKAFALRHGCNVWIIAHPKSQQPAKPGTRKLDAPGPYDISGGAMWANKTDLGITVHQDEGLTQIHLWKPRFRRWGRRGSIAKIEFDETSHRYRSPVGGAYGETGT